LSDLLRLTRRLSYNCPIEHISDPFFILYAQFKQQVLELQGVKNLEGEDAAEALKNDFDLSEISPFM